MPRLLIHVGYAKAGSTWLQTHLFPKAELGYLSLRRRPQRELLVHPHALDFDSRRCRAAFAEQLDEAFSQNLAPVMTWERLAGAPHGMGYDSKEMADRLHRAFPDARILFVIREQRSMIYSTYQQFIRGGAVQSLRDFLYPCEEGLGTFPAFDPITFDYDKLAAYYVQLFGREQVLVLPLEMFRKQPRDFVRQIGTLADVGVSDDVLDRIPFDQVVNPAMTPLEIGVRRRLNFLCVKHRRNPTPLLPIPGARDFLKAHTRWINVFLPKGMHGAMEKRLRRLVDAFVAKHSYGESNARLAAAFDLPLAAYGYEVANPTTERIAA